MIQGKTVLLTGGRGFIGTHLALRLCADNQVIVVDNGRRDAMRFFAPPPGIRFETRDVARPGALDDLLEGVDIVVHLAAVAGVSNYVRQPATTMVTNLIGTQLVLEAVKDRSIERLVNFSTSEVYGPSALGAREDRATALGPVAESRWTYSASKLAAEHLCLAYHRQYGVPVTSVRPFNIFGPGQVGEGAIHDIGIRALRGEPIRVTGDGQQVRTWCYIDDMIDATAVLMSNPAAIGDVFNVGNAEPVVPMIELARRLVERAGSSSPITFAPHIEADVMLRSPDVGHVRKRLGFRPRVDLDEGLGRTLDWYRDHLAELDPT
ncbi:MAG: NAD-dependent epimerase/dehydratase family protein [Myxococcota bacterium]|nr:NAD-dependent epimerase/dehydratase family protein [Myxococcota bacterium]